MYGRIKRNLRLKTRKDTQLKMYNPMTLPCLTYVFETWTLRGKGEGALEAGGMQFLRQAAGIALWDYETSYSTNKEITKK
jgi:hypothetical protein